MKARTIAILTIIFNPDAPGFSLLLWVIQHYNCTFQQPNGIIQ